MSTRSNVLNMYKNMLKLAKSLPKDKKEEAITNVRTQFRLNKEETNDEVITKLLQKAQSSISYLKIVTPKPPKGQSGITKIVFGTSSDKSKTLKAYSNWTGNNMDPDSVKRHYQDLHRAGFRDNSHAKGIF